MRPYFKYYKHASSCLSGDVVSRSGLYMRDARVRVGSSVGRESDRRASGRGHVRVVGARVVVSGIGEKRVRCIYAPGFLTGTYLLQIILPTLYPVGFSPVPLLVLLSQ